MWASLNAHLLQLESAESCELLNGGPLGLKGPVPPHNGTSDNPAWIVAVQSTVCVKPSESDTEQRAEQATDSGPLFGA
jgi:hypothetical protein